MSDQKIKNREALLSHGDAGAKAQVLELTERVLPNSHPIRHCRHLSLPPLLCAVPTAIGPRSYPTAL